ncbi:STAS domain-containing protein [Mesobacillus foraminis]|uniref:STAS domain-containing protein n=1 Tax=Mesobacillus foraminis TaxID=279826 RepID=UPI001BE7741B|nr:STAS domain-containing protein [Mesobacillus foraminis]MBT2759041.1 STAS domain-containing protein [Mesobacillus foraminis]
MDRNNTNEYETMHETINQLTKRVTELEQLVELAAVPIIPSIIPNTILIPVYGELSPERFQIIMPKILNQANSINTDTAIIDFTAISHQGIDDLAVLGKQLENLTEALNLMGVQVLFVGFSPQFAQELVKSGLDFIKELKAFSTFRTALQFLMKKKGLALMSIE